MIAPDEAEADVPAVLEPEILEQPGEMTPAEMEALAAVEPGEEQPVTPLPQQVEVADWLDVMDAPEPVDRQEEQELLAALAEIGPEPSESDLAEAEIPTWLEAMRPGVTPAPAEVEEEQDVETRGLLTGIPGVVQPATVIAAVPSAPVKPERIGAEAALARARLWQELIARSTQPSTQEMPRPQVKKTRDRVERWLVYGIVLLAVLVPLLTGVDLSQVFVLGDPLTTGAAEAYGVVNGTVTADAPVLIAFDYDPSFMGELQLQAEALLHHLTLREARIIIVSLTPEGAAMAQQAIDEVLVDRNYLSGEDYVNLGYLPGEAVGIRSLALHPRYLLGQAFNGGDLGEMLTLGGEESLRLDDMALIGVLTSSANDLRWWVEQKTALEDESDMQLPLVAGVSAAIEPLVRPYYDMDSPQIDGLIVGLAGAVDYESEMDWLAGPAHVRINAQFVGQLAVMALIALGVLVFVFSRRSDVPG
jgi:hypothetical protein